MHQFCCWFRFHQCRRAHRWYGRSLKKFSCSVFAVLLHGLIKIYGGIHHGDVVKGHMRSFLERSFPGWLFYFFCKCSRRLSLRLFSPDLDSGYSLLGDEELIRAAVRRFNFCSYRSMEGINVSTFNAVKEVARKAPEITRAVKNRRFFLLRTRLSSRTPLSARYQKNRRADMVSIG